VGSVSCHGPSSSEDPAPRSTSETRPVRPEGPTPTERVLRRVPQLDWQHFAPLFRSEWEHRDELDLTPFMAIGDPDDRKFAALAAATQSVLISNDDHLLARREELPVRVLKPTEFLAELIRGGADDRR
jgi:hypothetical protein